MSREAYGTGYGVQEIARNGAAVVVSAFVAVIQFCRCQVAVVVVRMVLIAEEALLSVYVGVEVAVMLRIAMSQTNGRKPLAIIVNHQTAKDYFVAPVPVDIHNGIVMVALPIPGRTGLTVRPAPAFRQLVSGGVDIQRHKLMTGINAASQKDAGLASVQIGGSEEMLGGTVTIAVTPGFVQIGLTALQALQRIVHRDIGHTGSAVDIHQVFRTLMHKPVSAATRGSAIVLRGVTNHVGLTVSRMDGSPVGRTE